MPHEFTKSTSLVAAMASAVLLSSPAAALRAVARSAGGSPGYTVLEQWPLAGSGGWDYLSLDSAAKRLFISRGDRVEVVDTGSGKSVGIISDTQGVHGITFAEELHLGFTSNGKVDSITVFDLSTLAPIKELPVPGHNPDAILYEPVGRHLFTFNGRSKDVTVFDAATLKVVSTIPVPDKPEFAVSDGDGQIFVNIESEAGQMVVIDSRNLKVKATWALPGCASPSGLALDKVKQRLFSVCDGNVMVVTASDTGKQVAKVRIGEGPDAVAFDAKRGLVFSSNGDGTLTVIHQDSKDHYSVVQNLTTLKGARTLALDSASGRLYSVTAKFGPTPAASVAQPHPRPVPIADTFRVLVIGLR